MPDPVSEIAVNSKKVSYQETFLVSGLKSAAVNEEIIQPFSSLPGWSAVFSKGENRNFYVGVAMIQEEDISHAVIRNVQFTVRCGSTDYKSSDRDFPHKNRKSGLTPGHWMCLDTSGNQDCMEIEVGLIFNDVEKQVKAVNDYFDTHPCSTGQLTAEDLKELGDLRQTEMKFYADENATELVLTEMVDLHAMAQLSKYIRGLLRFKRNQDDQPIQVSSKSEKLISEHFNEETVADFIDILHGQEFERRSFLEKSADYLIHMGHISNQFDVPNLKLMIDDCIFVSTKLDQVPERNVDSLVAAVEYALKTESASLLERLIGVIDLLELTRESSDYEKIRSVFRKHGGLMLLTVLDARRTT